jgi:hypothetical protein
VSAGPSRGDDPVRARRARVALLAARARALGWALFGLAVLAFAAGLILGLTALVVVVVVTALVLGSLLLAPAIVIGFGVRAAEREDPGT